jgi:antirestriction protein ArdC
MTTNKVDIYTEVTNRIIEKLEAGCIPWIKPWDTENTLDKNIKTGREYNGINRIILGMSGYQSNVWASFKQWSDLGAKVKLHEHGTRIVFYKPVAGVKVTSEGEEISYNSVFTTSYVFNAEQVEGIEIKPRDIEDKPFLNNVDIDNMVSNTGATIRHSGNSAYYKRDDDFINMPVKSDFNSEANYYATLLHELTHWSGAKHRLDRTKGKRFGDVAYAFEELIAELGSAFLCEKYAVKGDIRHEGYIQSWLQALKNDNKMIFKASAYAQKSTDYLVNFDALKQVA